MLVLLCSEGKLVSQGRYKKVRETASFLVDVDIDTTIVLSCQWSAFDHDHASDYEAQAVENRLTGKFCLRIKAILTDLHQTSGFIICWWSQGVSSRIKNVGYTQD